DGHQALFFDSAIGAHSMTTEMVVFGDEGLIKLEEDMIKAKPLYSRDMNNDGVLEVGSMYIPQGWEETAFADIPFIEYYSTYSIDGDSHKVMERYTDRERRFYIEIPPAWFEKVTLNKLDDGVQLVDIASRNVLFEVRWQENDMLAPASAT
ncbi:VCBS repeat-containing protein, partial [Bacillus cereus]